MSAIGNGNKYESSPQGIAECLVDVAETLACVETGDMTSAAIKTAEMAEKTLNWAAEHEWKTLPDSVSSQIPDDIRH